MNEIATFFCRLINDRVCVLHNFLSEESIERQITCQDRVALGVSCDLSCALL